MSTAVVSPEKLPVWHGMIVSTPGTCGGKPRIDGTRIKVQHVYNWHDIQGMSADEIIAEFPHLTHAGIYAALSYYWDHREEMARIQEEEEQWLEKFMNENPSQLQSKLTQQHGQDHSVSS